MMRCKNYLLLLLSLTLTGIPAYAVDYLNCREMLRTKNEFEKKLSANNVAYLDCAPTITDKQLENIISRDKQIIKLKNMIEKAGEKFERDQFIIDDNGNMVHNENISTEDITRMIDNLSETEYRLRNEILNRTKLLVFIIVKKDYDDCLDTKTKKGNFNKEEQKSSYKRIGYNFYDDNGYYWYKKILRVKEDMRKANCPY